jgi:acetyl-CoA acetyltransferase
MASLKPAFDPAGTVIAANASKINDGAAAVVLASARAVERRGLKPLARVRSYGHHAQAPRHFTTAPVGAIKMLSRAQGSARTTSSSTRSTKLSRWSRRRAPGSRGSRAID